MARKGARAPGRSRTGGRGTDARQRLGRLGELAAERALERAGLSVVDRRFRLRLGEIDLIAVGAGLVVFVEVKARGGEGWGQPAEAVTARKRERMARVAAVWLARRGEAEAECPCRFDVVEVWSDGAGVSRVNHIVDAFRVWSTGEPGALASLTAAGGMS